MNLYTFLSHFRYIYATIPAMKYFHQASVLYIHTLCILILDYADSRRILARPNLTPRNRQKHSNWHPTKRPHCQLFIISPVEVPHATYQLTQSGTKGPIISSCTRNCSR